MPSTADTPRTIAVLGNPNVGKTTLFNHLCGVRHKTANFPGTSQEAAPEMPQQGEEFHTDLGRKVFGGGGITPDVPIELPDGPQILTVLFAKNSFFEFAVDYHDKHPVPNTKWKPEPD